MRPDNNQINALRLSFLLVMVWPSGTSIPLSSDASRDPLRRPPVRSASGRLDESRLASLFNGIEVPEGQAITKRKPRRRAIIWL